MNGGALDVKVTIITQIVLMIVWKMMMSFIIQ